MCGDIMFWCENALSKYFIDVYIIIAPFTQAVGRDLMLGTKPLGTK